MNKKIIATIIITVLFCLVTWFWVQDKNVQFEVKFNTFTPEPVSINHDSIKYSRIMQEIRDNDGNATWAQADTLQAILDRYE